MNRIFKVIWSEARNAYVVVSELTKRQSKSCSTKKLLATLIAAGVFSIAGMHAPVSAAEIEEATRDNYIAIEATHFKDSDPLYHGEYEVGQSVDIGKYQYTLTKIQISGNQYALYWVRDGYGLKVETDAEYFEGADTGLKVSPYKLKDSASTEGLVIRGLSGISDTKIKTAVNEDSLHLLSYDNYAGVSNSGGIVTERSYNYFILRNNRWEDVGQDYTPNGQKFSKNFQAVSYNKATGYYEFNGKQVAFENVYNIDNKLGVFLTSENGKEVYTGPVYGLHNEILITAYDEKSKTWSTVWGSEMSDPNSTIGSMTVGQFNNILADIHNEDAILADADVVKTVVNGTSSAINLQNKKGNLIPGITVTRTAIDGSDTVVTITEEENKNNKIDLVTGSRVSAEASNGNLTKLTINGVDYALSGVDTNTKYQITKKEKDSSTPANVVKTYNFNEIGSSGVGVDLIDTDTTYRVEDVTTSTPGAISAKKLVNNLGQEIVTFVDTDTDTKYTDGTGITIDPNNNNQISIIPSAVANSVRIRYKANNETAKSVSLSDGLNFVQGKNVQISTEENGVVNISATDTNTQNTTVAGKNIIVGENKQEDGSIKYTVNTKDDVEFNSVTVGKTTGFNGVVIGGSGINMNNQKITGLKAGVDDTDAVNFRQLKEYAATAGANTKVLAGKNISVESNTAGGKNEYTVNLNNNVTLGSDTEDGSLVVKSSVGDVLISNGQIIGNKYAITNDGGAIFAKGVIRAAGDGTFRAANGSFTVFADGTIDSKMGADGRLLATSQGLIVAKGSSSFGVTEAGISLSWGKSALVVEEGGTAIKGGLNVLGSKITNVAAGEVDTDAVNVGQLREAIAAGDTHIKSGVYQVGEVSLDEEGNKSQGVSIDVVDGSGKVTGNVKITDVAKASDLGDVSKLHADLKNSESNVTTVVDAVNKLNGKVGDLQYLEVTKGDIENGDNTTTAIGKLNQALKDVSQKATAHNTVSNADTNITISKSTNSDGGTNYALALNKQKINLGNVIIEGEKGSITAKNVTAGKTSIGDAGVQFDGKTYIGDKGLNANDQKITNVAAGELSKTSKDAVNGSQLYATNQQVNQNTANINSLDNRISKLGSRVNKVGAGAAALAALHPMDFDPDDKLSFAVGMGNYAGENAAAIGAFYRPNEKVMMSVGGTYGNDENMVNVGLSFALDRTNNVSNSRTAMAREIIELRSHVAKQDQQIAQLTALVNKLVGNDAVKGEGVLFPDVPENHWAYEYINGLVQAGVIDGYPDGTFGGERSLTRYEYASMLYKAMLKGTILHKDIAKEFESEIARIRVDRISGKDNDANKIERVRVNYQNRDNYGSRIAK